MTRLVPLTYIVASLTACSVVDHEALHDATVVVLEESRKKTDTEWSELEGKIAHQSDILSDLDRKVASISDGMEALKQKETVVRSSVVVDDPVPVLQVAEPSGNAMQNDQRPPLDTVDESELKTDKDVILGEIERISFEKIDRSFDARVDTGAETSSLNAVDITEFERNGKKWVRFRLTDGSKGEEATWIDAPIERTVRVRQQATVKAQRRFVISKRVTLGPINQKAEFTLADRTKMSHPVLLGREFIQDVALVDVSLKYNLSKKKKKP